jgi:hypothetical protein
MSAIEVYNVWKKYKPLLNTPPGFGKMAVAEQVKILNKLARSKQAGMAGFVKDYNEIRQKSKKVAPKKEKAKAPVKKVYKPIQKEPKDISDYDFGPAPVRPTAPPPITPEVAKIIQSRQWVDPAIELRKAKVKEAEALRNEAKKAASNILNITLDNVIKQTRKADQKKRRQEVPKGTRVPGKNIPIHGLKEGMLVHWDHKGEIREGIVGESQYFDQAKIEIHNQKFTRTLFVLRTKLRMGFKSPQDEAKETKEAEELKKIKEKIEKYGKSEKWTRKRIERMIELYPEYKKDHPDKSFEDIIKKFKQHYPI